MTITLTNVAALVVGLAIIASQLVMYRNNLFRSLATAIGLAVVAAAIIHAVAS